MTEECTAGPGGGLAVLGRLLWALPKYYHIEDSQVTSEGSTGV